MCIRDRLHRAYIVPILFTKRLVAVHLVFCHRPVSYTHLDVYKRQPLGNGIHLAEYSDYSLQFPCCGETLFAEIAEDDFDFIFYAGCAVPAIPCLYRKQISRGFFHRAFCRNWIRADFSKGVFYGGNGFPRYILSLIHI